MTWPRLGSEASGRRRAWSLAASIAAALSVYLGLAAAKAQENGVKVGEGRLHTQVQAESHHVYNPGYTDAAGAKSDVCGIIRPKLAYELRGDQMDVDLDANLELRGYLGYQDAATRELSTAAGGLTAQLNVNPLGDVGLLIAERLTRAADAANQSTSARLLHVLNSTTFTLRYKPGGGALLFDAGYGLLYDYYDRSGNGVITPENLDALRQMPTLKTSWKFLPRTALFLEASGDLATYPASRPDYNRGVKILTAQAGATGSVTGKVSALVKAGYGDTFIDTPDNYRAAIGQVELTFEISATAKLRAGLLRTVQPATLYKFYGLMRGYLGYEHMLFGNTAVQLKLRYDDLRFGNAEWNVRANGRVDGSLAGEVSIERRFRDWLSVTVSDTFDVRTSNFSFTATPDGQPGTMAKSETSYMFNDIFLRIAFLY